MALALASAGGEAPLAGVSTQILNNAEAVFNDMLKERLSKWELVLLLRSPYDRTPFLTFFHRIQEAFRTDDARTLASLIAFPITVAIDDRPMIIATSAEFVANYPRIVDPDLKRVVLDQRDEDLFINWRGVMIGRGQIWIGEDRIEYFSNTGMWDRWRDEANVLNPKGRTVAHRLRGDALRQSLALLAGVLDFRAEVETNQTNEVDHVWTDICIYEFYLADLNNDGHDDYVVTETSTGAGFGSIHGVWSLKGGKPVRLPIERIAARFFQPDDPEDFDWNDVQSCLANPFIVKKDGTVYFGFDRG